MLDVVQRGRGSISGASSQTSARSPQTPSTPPVSAVKEAQRSGTPVDAAIVAADNSFGLSLFKVLNQCNSGNLAISPTSIALALQMVYNGAEGSTQQAMARAMHLQNLAATDVDFDNAALQASLIDPDPQVELTVANSMRMHLSMNPVLPSFTRTNQTYYAARIGDLAGTPDNVNARVASQTAGLTTKILLQDDYGLVNAVVANALYFKGAWATPFGPTLTAAAPFTLTDGAQVTCQMMHHTGSFAYFQGPNLQAIRLPYGQKNHMSMVILLPNAGVNLGAIVAGLTTTSLDFWLSQLQTSTIAVALPRFTSSYAHPLATALTARGMGVAFEPYVADFSGMAPNAHISKVEHASVVQVDEAGTMAAAATTVTVATAVVAAPTASITMDHPFFYAIRDDRTGALLFVGVLFNPS